VKKKGVHRKGMKESGRKMGRGREIDKKAKKDASQTRRQIHLRVSFLHTLRDLTRGQKNVQGGGRGVVRGKYMENRSAPGGGSIK